MPFRLALALLAAALAPQSASAQRVQEADSLRPIPAGVEASRGALGMRVTALTPHIIRVRARLGASGEDASWAVSAELRARRAAVKNTTEGFVTSALSVRLDPRTLSLSLFDKAGRRILSSGSPPQFGSPGFELRQRIQAGERFYGLGDKTGPFDRRGASYVNWNIDAWGFGAATDPLYKSVPFFVSTGAEGGSYGVFLDNSWRTWFDFGHRESDVLTFGAAGGAVDYYIITGPSIAEVVRRYTDLTGKAPLVPQWALGFQQSRYSYMNDAEVRGIAARLRRDRVPADVIWLDIDFQDRNRPFTVNSKAFPSLPRLARDLGADGIKLVAITDLHIAHAADEGYAPYDSGVRGGHFLKNPDGSTYVAPVWPGPSVFPDFTRAATRRWWGGLYADLVNDGIAGFWNDMNEPAIFDTPTKTMPLDTIHRISGDGFTPRTASHAEVHNVYGMQNSRATFEGLQRLRPDERPFVMTRASFAGGQRYAVTWTGDNSATWDHLKLMVQQLLNLGLSGFPYAGADIGGFTGGASPDLLTRFYQVGSFTPIFRNHVAKDAPRAEPWADSPRHLAIRRRFIEERYRLMPYLYAAAEAISRTGDPLIRPVFYDYPEIAAAYCDQSMSFTVAGRLLVAAPPRPESPRDYDVCLPRGGWFDLWTGLPAARQASEERRFEVVKERPQIDRLPVFVRAGTILPRQPLVQSTSQTPKGPLEIHIYPGESCAGDLYFDDGHTLGYTRGEFLRQHLRCTAEADGSVRVHFDARTGKYRPWWRNLRLVVHGWNGQGEVLTGARSVRPKESRRGQTLSFMIGDQAGPSELLVRRR